MKSIGDAKTLQVSMCFGLLTDITDSHLPRVSLEPDSHVDDVLLLWNLVGLIQVDIEDAGFKNCDFIFFLSH